MSLDVVVTSFDAMWLLVLRHVTWCVRCHGDELITVVPRNRMECYEPKMPLVVKRRVVQSVTMWWSKELLQTTLYYKVHLQYHSVVLQTTTPVRLCTTRYLSSTTLYYKVRRQYYSVLLQHYKTPSTTPIYEIQLQYYSVLQRTSPVLLCTSKTYSSTTPSYTALLQ